MTDQVHCIRQQYLQVEVNGTEADALALQQRLPAFCQTRLMPALERVLAQYAPQEGSLTIERLDIDAGTLSVEGLEQDWAEAVAQALTQALKSLAKSRATEAHPVPGNVQYKAGRQVNHEAFIHFIYTGRLPWAFRLPAGRGLEAVLIEDWQTPAISDAQRLEFDREIARALASETVCRRLTQQFSPAFLSALLFRQSPENRLGIENILSLPESSPLPSDIAVTVKRQLWENLLAACAAGHIAAALDFAREAWQAWAEAGRPATGLTIFGALSGASALTRPANENSAVSGKHEVSQTEGRFEDKLKISQTAVIPDLSGFNPDSNTPVSGGMKTVEATGYPGTGPVELKEGVYLDCAGLVLLHPFLARCFEALGIAHADRLSHPERALCLLHYLATGQTVAPEHELILPKILCNVALEQPVASDVVLTMAEQDEAKALLEAVIRHWEVLRNTSVDGLRGTFLVRPGKLSLREDGDWRLQIETKAYDILLDQLPWGIGMIKLPWMQHMLWVEWGS